DGAGKVTGTAVYAADFALPGMLVGKVFRSTEPHARIVRVDTARARALPGVRAVMTAADVPDVRYGGALKDETVFARGKVRYVGQPVAAVAAWDSSGQVTVWSNTQLPFEVQNTLAEILQMAPSKIRVVVPGIGGGFGGKLRVGVEHFAAFLAKATGRPVKVITTSEEEL